MTILETLQTDHRQVKELLETVLSTDDAKKRSDLFKQFRTELTAHSRAEERVLYRGMEKSEEGKGDALEGAVEHEVVDRLMEDLSRSRSTGTDKWTARCTVLQELLEHHLIRRSVLETERAALLDLRERGEIDDNVWRRIERDLDLEELRMDA